MTTGGDSKASPSASLRDRLLAGCLSAGVRGAEALGPHRTLRLGAWIGSAWHRLGLPRV